MSAFVVSAPAVAAECWLTKLLDAENAPAKAVVVTATVSLSVSVQPVDDVAAVASL